LSTRSKVWLAAVMASVAVLALAALILPHSLRLTALSDIIQCFLLASGAASFLPLAWRAHGRLRLFWALIGLGVAFWLSYQILWTYYEVLLRRDVPDIFSGDVVLFLHIVPLMAALALRPHVSPDEYATRVGRLDFVLLLVWWLYLYVLIVIPWQYVQADAVAYIHNLNAVYFAEQLAFLGALVAFCVGGKGQWRIVYANLFGAGVGYAVSSSLANWAIVRNTYYSGCFYDVPLAGAMAWLTWIGLRARAEVPPAKAREVSTAYGVWVARFGMIAVFSLPLFAAWAISDVAVPPRIRVFRLTLTLAAAFVMGVMVFIRQHLLDRELTILLNNSRESVDNLQHLQGQLLQSEKVASIGQLVGGAAHELNNPITAMLGYSDLLLSAQLTAEQEPLALKIGQYVRRTKSLVASLISFARQSPAPKTPIDLNTLARTAVKLTQPQWESLHIEVRTQFDAALPKVMGDSNQLLQVCLQLVGNCLHVMGAGGSKVLMISTERGVGISVLRIATEPMIVRPTSGTGAAASVDPENSLGLSACQGIVQEHRGQVSRELREDGRLLLRVELPATEPPPVKTKEASTVPVLWQSRPFA
jgi:signal transduction histidine kinase